MEYQFLTQDERDDIIADAMHQREIEHFHYSHNANTYNEMLKTLPADDWPADLVSFKGKKREQLVQEVPTDKLSQTMDYAFRDQLTHLKNTELIEKAKIDKIYTALEAQFGGDTTRKNAAIARIKAKK